MDVKLQEKITGSMEILSNPVVITDNIGTKTTNTQASLSLHRMTAARIRQWLGKGN